MSTVTIGTDSYEVYGTLAGAKKYLGVALSEAAAAWNALVDDDAKEKTMVNATRLLDRQIWKGTAVGTPAFDVVLQWPRAGATDRNGVVVDESTVPVAIEQATYELAALIALDPTVYTAASTGSNIQSLRAGPVGITYFRATNGTRLPSVLMDLIGQFMGSDAADSAAPIAYGVSDTSAFINESQYQKIGPL